jgi:hypothetical protein
MYFLVNTVMSPPGPDDSPLYKVMSLSAVQLEPWSLTLDRARKVGDELDNAMMESFWSSTQIELLNCML